MSGFHFRFKLVVDRAVRRKCYNSHLIKVPEIGDKLSQYTIVSVIGSGGMGRVFLAEDAKLGRKTALKFLSHEFASDREHLDRFVREARAASALNHPNICTIYEINDAAELPFIAMEYIDGETVVELIRRKGP